jgi:hypothetical protein
MQRVSAVRAGVVDGAGPSKGRVGVRGDPRRGPSSCGESPVHALSEAMVHSDRLPWHRRDSSETPSPKMLLARFPIARRSGRSFRRQAVAFHAVGLEGDEPPSDIRPRHRADEPLGGRRVRIILSSPQAKPAARPIGAPSREGGRSRRVSARAHRTPGCPSPSADLRTRSRASDLAYQASGTPARSWTSGG